MATKSPSLVVLSCLAALLAGCVRGGFTGSGETFDLEGDLAIARDSSAGHESASPTDASTDVDSAAQDGPGRSCASLAPDEMPGPPPNGVALKVTAVAASRTNACAIRLGGALLCWGENCHGQLASGDALPRAIPLPVALPTAGPVTAVAVGSGFVCAVAGGVVHCWGRNDRGQLGLGDTVDRASPQPVDDLPPVATLSAGNDAVCAIVADGGLYCWGSNAEGQLVQPDPFPDPGKDYLTPVAVDGQWREVAVSEGHACGIRIDGSLWCWGRNNLGQLGLGSGAPAQIRQIARVGTATSWVQVLTGPSGTCGRQQDGSLWCWGSDIFYSTGFGDGLIRHEPELREASWEDVDLDAFHGCGVRAGDLWCWGRSEEGQLGDHSPSPSLPQAVFPNVAFHRVSVGRFSSFAVGDDGTLMSAGLNHGGQLGRSVPDRDHRFDVVIVLPGP